MPNRRNLCVRLHVEDRRARVLRFGPAGLLPAVGLLAVGLLIGAFGAAGASAAAQETFEAHPLANLDRGFDVATVPGVEAPVAVAHGLVFTWSRELWVTDGTAGGTRRLCGPDPDLCVHVRNRLASPPGRLYFIDDRLREQDRALWRTDGTEAGTFPVTSPRRTRLDDFFSLDAQAQAASGRLFFVAEDLEKGTGLEPWVTDGTMAGTHQVRDLASGPQIVDSRPAFGTSLGARMIFAASDGSGDREPWVTDGTSEGTFELLDLARGGGSTPIGFAALGDHALLFIDSGTGGESLWRTDGLRNGATERVLDFPADQGGVDATTIVTVADRVLFFLGGRLWVTDGTAGGTRALAEPTQDQILMPDLHPAGQREIFTILSFTAGLRIWGTDGTPQGTRMLADPCPGTCEDVPVGFHPVGDQTVFSVEDAAAGRELWISDGTPQGTRRLVDLCPGPCSSNPRVVGTSGVLVGVSADAGDGRELWRVDTTTGAAVALTDLELSDPFPGTPDGALFNGALIFSAVDPGSGQALWRTDGTASGTGPYYTLVEPADGGSSPARFTRLGREIVFTAETPEPGLWATDGTAGGIRRVWTAPEGTEPIGPLVALGGSGGPLLFVTQQGGLGPIDLYRSDGTSKGTVRLADDLDRGLGAGLPVLLFGAGDRVFYLATGSPRPSPDGGVWVSDGTVAGTRRLRQLSALFFGPVEVVNGDLVFAVTDGTTGTTSLWVSDGTVSGTHPLLDADRRPIVDPIQMAVVGSSLFFIKVDRGGSVPRSTLWVTDGTSGGTHRVTSIVGNPTEPSFLTAVGTTLFFDAPAPDDDSLRVLWRSDGSPQGTRPVTTSATGFLVAAGLQAVGKRLLFFGRPARPTNTAADSIALWITDGTPARTRRLAEVRRQVQAVQVGESLLFIEQEPPPSFPPFGGPPAAPARLWRSDGTEEGTVALDPPQPESEPLRLETVAGRPLLLTRNEEQGEDLWLLDGNGHAVTRIGRFTSIPGHFTQLGKHVVFPATRLDTGTEPWVFALPAGPLAARRLISP